MTALQSVRWHSREQYRTASHRAHTVLATSDAHPTHAAVPLTHSALSDSSFPLSSATACRPVRASTTRARFAVSGKVLHSPPPPTEVLISSLLHRRQLPVAARQCHSENRPVACRTELRCI